MIRITLAIVSLSLLLPAAPVAQREPLAPEQQVAGQTITSRGFPPVSLTFADDLRYQGATRLILYGLADAELHLFGRPSSDGTVTTFYWTQFEHFLPDNDRHYDAGSTKTLTIGGLSFIYDVLGYADFDAIESGQPGSDGAAAVEILRRRDLRFPKHVGRMRMFHFADDRRSELMIIYGEALPPDVVIPAATPRFQLDEPAQRALVDHVQARMTIRGLQQNRR